MPEGLYVGNQCFLLLSLFSEGRHRIFILNEVRNCQQNRRGKLWMDKMDPSSIRGYRENPEYSSLVQVRSFYPRKKGEQQEALVPNI